MKVYIIGNPIVAGDNKPFVMLPKLKKSFPHIQFEVADPNENFIPEEGSIIIDTIQGIDSVTLFDSLDAFQKTSSVSPHDYDLLLHLQLLQKLHKITSIRIIGIPQKVTGENLFKEVSHYLNR
jgi:hypothetical protein